MKKWVTVPCFAHSRVWPRPPSSVIKVYRDRLFVSETWNDNPKNVWHVCFLEAPSRLYWAVAEQTDTQRVTGITTVNRIHGWETRWTHYLCWGEVYARMWSSRITCVLYFPQINQWQCLNYPIVKVMVGWLQQDVAIGCLIKINNTHVMRKDHIPA